MSHINGVIDADPHFEIDIVTRSIRNVSKTKTTLVQYDHNSERFSFTLPRFIEGHDMMECNRVQVHYINIDTKTKVAKADVHNIKDLAICEDEPKNVCCTWLIKETATQYAGVLQFSLRFACVSEGGVVDYSWGTVPFLGISVSEGINNAEAIVEQYSDILEQWKAELEEAAGGTVKLDTTLTQEGKAADAKAVGDAIQRQADMLYSKNNNKNIIDPSKVIRNGDGDIDATTGEVIDGECYVYGPYYLTIGETYTFSKKADSTIDLYFYTEDGSCEECRHITQGMPGFKFTAEYPIVKLVTERDVLEISAQLELGDTATEYESFSITLNEEVQIPIVGKGQLETEAETLIGAVNELNGDIVAIQERIDKIKEDDSGGSTVVIGKNLFNPAKLLRNGDGNVSAQTGEIIDGTYYVYDKHDLTVGETYTISKTGKAVWLYFYNADGSFVFLPTTFTLGPTLNQKTFTAEYPSAMIVGYADMVEYKLQLEKGDTATEYEPYTETSNNNSETPDTMVTVKNLKDKKILILGDSISTGDTSAKIYPGEKYNNYNRWVEALIEEGYFDESKVRNDSIHATGFVTRYNAADDIITRMRNITDTDYDLVIVFAGINDSLRADTYEVGFGMDEQGNKETDIEKYFVPAVDTFFAELTEKFVEARICVILPLRTRHKYAGHGWATVAPPTLADGSTARLETDYADYIAKVAEEYCLPVLDATRHSGFFPKPGTEFYYRWVNGSINNGLNAEGKRWSDGVHPTEEYSRKYLAPYIRGFIDGLI